jgi:hypothetical protein
MKRDHDLVEAAIFADDLAERAVPMAAMLKTWEARGKLRITAETLEARASIAAEHFPGVAPEEWKEVAPTKNRRRQRSAADQYWRAYAVRFDEAGEEGTDL